MRDPITPLLHTRLAFCRPKPSSCIGLLEIVRGQRRRGLSLSANPSVEGFSMGGSSHKSILAALYPPEVGTPPGVGIGGEDCVNHLTNFIKRM